MNPETDVYPMPLFVRLTVEDLAASLAWYRALGFDVVYETPVMAHVRYRRYADVMLVTSQADLGDESDESDEATPKKGDGVTVYLTVEAESVDDVAARASDHGATADGPHETGWNTRELALRDPDGYELVFAQPLDTDRSFESVMGEE